MELWIYFKVGVYKNISCTSIELVFIFPFLLSEILPSIERPL